MTEDLSWYQYCDQLEESALKKITKKLKHLKNYLPVIRMKHAARQNTRLKLFIVKAFATSVL